MKNRGGLKVDRCLCHARFSSPRASPSSPPYLHYRWTSCHALLERGRPRVLPQDARLGPRVCARCLPPANLRRSGDLGACLEGQTATSRDSPFARAQQAKVTSIDAHTNAQPCTPSPFTAWPTDGHPSLITQGDARDAQLDRPIYTRLWCVARSRSPRTSTFRSVLRMNGHGDAPAAEQLHVEGTRSAPSLVTKCIQGAATG